MSYLLPCRPRCLFFTVHRSFPPAFHFQIIPVVKPRQFIFILPLRKICQISPHTITFNFTFHEKTLPTTFSASARSFRKSSSPLRRLFTLHPNTLSCPVQCRYLPSPRYIPTCPLQNSRSPAFARSSTRHISSPSLQIAFIGYPSLISASRQIKTPFIKYTINTTPEQSIPSAAFPPHRYWHPRYPFAHSTTFRPPLRNPLLHKKPLFRFSPQKPIRIQSFS
jgi:hypothetical protein